MALQKNQRTLLRGIPGPILAVIAILWITAALGLVDSGGDWADYTDRADRDPITGFLLICLIVADLVNAVLGFAIQMRWNWARSYAITLSLVRAAAAAIAAVTGDMSALVLIAVYLVIVVLMILPSAAAWFDG
ncbi:hypothetical protein [Glycomyces tenuis]|uniref:hypothetical protein n=1 Tax=Glycomyces tenuis TaxID=58116 RepID=UPI0004207E26|nr:hypothetical protein [Glycomyces tenuis]